MKSHPVTGKDKSPFSVIAHWFCMISSCSSLKPRGFTVSVYKIDYVKIHIDKSANGGLKVRYTYVKWYHIKPCGSGLFG